MATTNLKKNSQGYGYKYTDLAEIHNFLESQGITYYQYIEPQDGVDYIWTVPIINGEEQNPRRGCRIVEAKLSGKENPVQAYGASLTYCRRYSLLLAMGLATTDDDAACLTVANEQPQDDNVYKASLEYDIGRLAGEKNIPISEILERAGVGSVMEMEIPQMESCIRSLNKSKKR